MKASQTCGPERGHLRLRRSEVVRVCRHKFATLRCEILACTRDTHSSRPLIRTLHSHHVFCVNFGVLIDRLSFVSITIRLTHTQAYTSAHPCMPLTFINQIPNPNSTRSKPLTGQPAKEMVAHLRESQELAHKSRANMWRYGDCQSDDEEDF